ncbi:Nn.00g101110.m01.CDS01 [Neocucurbitaria sp. VM-36]
MAGPDSRRNAWRDYNHQLLLLGQQNNKRMEMVRLEQETLRRRLRQEPVVDIAQADEAVTDSHSDTTSTRVVSNPAQEDADPGATSITRKRKRVSRARDQASDADENDNNNSNSRGSRVGHGGRAEADCGQRIPPHFDLIYRISCEHSGTSSHPVFAFRDIPTSNAPSDSGNTNSSRSHLSGSIPIYDLDRFMADDTDDTAFVIIRSIKCSEASVLMARDGVPLQWTEDIFMRSQVSKRVLKEVATRYPASKSQIEALLGYMEAKYGKEYEEADRLFGARRVDQTHVLKLFKPNDLVVSDKFERPAAFVLQEWPYMDNEYHLTLNCWSFQTNGHRFVRKRTVLKMGPIEPKSTAIHHLPIYPLKYATPDVRMSIQAQGEKQWELRHATQITYKGRNVNNDECYPDARFMIDHRMYRKMHESARAFQFNEVSIRYPFDRMALSLDNEQKPSDTSLLLLPPDIYGFYLNEKKWISLFVDCIHPISWNKRAYDRLVLPAQTKELIRALVTVLISQRGVKQGLGTEGKRIDIISGKGNGLIMLLHGGPGTGKTVTAESIAEIAEVPLYRVTCGDIGTNSEAVEKYLNTVLHLGKTWNCVLLLAEADVFLEERSMADLKRNSLVSVFLRILEYYDGIVILTTNRVGVFDEAFKSRIHLPLHYENLDQASRRQIWQNLIEMLEEDKENVNFDEVRSHLDDLGRKELNGRQIRTTLTNARRLAMFKTERLEWRHLVQALSVSSNFTTYSKRMQGHTDDQRARDLRLR